MIKNCIKNFCLITFALVGPITLPAGGIQKNLNDYSIFDSSEEIILNTDLFIHCFPQVNAKKLRKVNVGDSVSVLRYWHVSESERWIRVQLSNNLLTDTSNTVRRGWLKI